MSKDLQTDERAGERMRFVGAPSRPSVTHGNQEVLR